MRLVITALLLAGCQTIPAELHTVKSAVDARITYQHYAKWDLRYLPAGGTGNCATFAYNYAIDAMKKGHSASVKACHIISTGEAHAYTLVDNVWALDNRMDYVAMVGENGCK